MSDEQTPKSPPMSAKAMTTEPSVKIADLIDYGNQLELTDLWQEHKTRLRGYIAKHMILKKAVTARPEQELPHLVTTVIG
ncbi:hypothetical protein BBC27_00660 [Acidithiobacillus ferrivorans]|uniref:Uncharacterized protein n=1 Tax=Acidithiobacillus ferrivorans TaxID=160808 RepID=A0A1B9C108_9PROT|nr:hypothetical protein [Acidithiobacillus ferrivorans]OCB03647.1 hypothetical protein BBC27_00660 [Acidithiobacillus ferrivorans]